MCTVIHTDIHTHFDPDLTFLSRPGDHEAEERKGEETTRALTHSLEYCCMCEGIKDSGSNGVDREKRTQQYSRAERGSRAHILWKKRREKDDKRAEQ